MKKLVFVLLSCCLVNIISAQTPNLLQYQAVIRNSSGAVVANQPVGMRVSILKGTASGTTVYAETHRDTTTANGMVTVDIGAGTLVSGNFTSINWGQGPFFIKTETDVNGGTSYQLMGTTQLLSVPYALYTNDVPMSKSGDTIRIGSSRLIIPGTTFIPGTVPASLDFGLIAYYPFSGNAQDSSGNGNHGTVNGATLTVDRFGTQNRAYLFNGVNQNIITPPLVKGLSKFSISFWAKVLNWQDSCAFGKYLYSMNSTSGVLGDGVSIGRHPMTGTRNMLFGIYDFTPGIGWQWVNSGVNPSSETYYHIVSTYDGTNLRMYINGALVGSVPYSKPVHTTADKSFIGSSSYSCSYVNAVIDDFRCYNRVLSDNEIQYLYQN